ncbi:VOC family protein [Streptomyces youssoufiensis]
MTTQSPESPEFDHLLHGVPDVPSAVAAYTAAGLPAHVNPPYLGFQNGAWRLDVRYVEILTVVDHAEFADSPYGRAMAPMMPFVTDQIAAGGGGLNFAVNVTDATATTERLRRAGHEVELVTFAKEGSPVSFREAFLADAPRWAPFFISYEPDRQVILDTYRGGGGRRGAHDLAGFVIETPEPAVAADWLSRLLCLPTTADGTVVPLPGGHVHFTAGPADRITTLLLSDGTPPTTRVAGLDVCPA